MDGVCPLSGVQPIAGWLAPGNGACQRRGDLHSHDGQNDREFTTPSALHLVVGDGRTTHLRLYEDTLTVYKAFAP
jgi:ketosteroid isomerase-like protein